jgi:peptide/nickel transport system ATP-binding protein
LILELMKQLKREFNLTYLFITHDLATAKYLCDRIAIMYLGRIVEIGTKDQVFRTPHHPYTKALLQAVPVPDPKERRKDALPRGEIPSAVNPPPGCHFHPRCPFAIDPCRSGRPPLRELSPGHFSACILEP